MVMMIEAMIADDHPIVREGLKMVLPQEESDNVEVIRVVGEAANADELFDQLKEKEPDIIVLDLIMPGKSGLDILKSLVTDYPDIPVLVLSVHSEERYAVRALKAGAAGYLSKDSLSKELVNAINRIVKEKKKYISPAVAEMLADQVNTATGQPRHKQLSDREYQVMCMLGSGMDIDEIAENLSLSDRTIHTYRSRMMKKMNFKTNVDITHYTIRHNLIDQPA